jgi:hypothetical protein
VSNTLQNDRTQANIVALNRETRNPAVVEAKGLQYLIDHVSQSHGLPLFAPGAYHQEVEALTEHFFPVVSG